VPERSQQLAGLVGDILGAEALRDGGGALTGQIRITFRITDGAGRALPSLSGKVCTRGVNVSALCTTDGDCPGGTCVALDRVGFVMSGLDGDFGGSEMRTCTGGTEAGAACTTDADCDGGGACVGARVVLSPVAVGGGASGTLTGPDGAGVYTYTTGGAANLIPTTATGTWRVGLEARRPVVLAAPSGSGPSVSEVVQNDVLDFDVGGTAVPTTRRHVVTTDACHSCHGVFSAGFSVHGNLRNQVEHCLICHNPRNSDFARRVRSFCAVTCGTNRVANTAAAGDDVQLIPVAGACSAADTCAVAVGDDGVAATAAAGDDGQRIAVGVGAAAAETETINLKSLLHRLHSGHELSVLPFIVYGFGSAPLGFTPHDFGDIRFPRDRRDCAACHRDDSQLLPVAGDALPNRHTVVRLNPDATMWASTPFVEAISGETPPVQAACVTCHDSADARAHAEIQTTPSGVESCGVCHGEGRIEPVSEVHR
jgi:hypothetical protein